MTLYESKAWLPTQPHKNHPTHSKGKALLFSVQRQPRAPGKGPNPRHRAAWTPFTLTLRSGGWAMTPPEDRLSLKSAPPEVSVVLPTGQGRGGVSEDMEVWCVTTGRRKRSEPEEHLCPTHAGRETGSTLQLTRKTLTLETRFPQLTPSLPVLPNQSLLSHSRHSPPH